MTNDEKIVRVGGVDLCVQAFGASADPPILLIHGTATPMLGWEDEFCEQPAARIPVANQRAERPIGVLHKQFLRTR
jgi:pimeloyl-ACP methyl ester carboxylesterase